MLDAGEPGQLQILLRMLGVVRMVVADELEDLSSFSDEKSKSASSRDLLQDWTFWRAWDALNDIPREDARSVHPHPRWTRRRHSTSEDARDAEDEDEEIDHDHEQVLREILALKACEICLIRGPDPQDLPLSAGNRGPDPEPCCVGNNVYAELAWLSGGAHTKCADVLESILRIENGPSAGPAGGGDGDCELLKMKMGMAPSSPPSTRRSTRTSSTTCHGDGEPDENVLDEKKLLLRLEEHLPFLQRHDTAGLYSSNEKAAETRAFLRATAATRRRLSEVVRGPSVGTLFSLLGDEAEHVEVGVSDGVGGALLDPDAADFACAFTRYLLRSQCQHDKDKDDDLLRGSCNNTKRRKRHGDCSSRQVDRPDPVLDLTTSTSSPEELQHAHVQQHFDFPEGTTGHQPHLENRSEKSRNNRLSRCGPEIAGFSDLFSRWGKRQTWEETVGHRYVELEASREGDTMCLMRLGRFLDEIRPMKPTRIVADDLPQLMEVKQLREIVGDDARAAFLREVHENVLADDVASAKKVEEDRSSSLPVHLHRGRIYRASAPRHVEVSGGGSETDSSRGIKITTTSCQHHKINSPATPYYLAQLDCRAHFGSGRRSLQDLTSQVWQRILATRDPRTLPELPDLAHVSYQPLLFLGPAGTETPLHQDPHPNFFVQVVGCKFFRLIPDSSETVGKGNVVQRCAEPGRNHFARNSEDLMRKKHLLANPGIEDSDKPPECFNIDVILKPGDCLFIPKGCWHYVKSLTASVSLSYMVGEGDEDHFPSWRTLCSGAYPDDPYVD